MVEPTIAFKQMVAKVTSGAYKPEDLFLSFGTHLCLKVQMGGWWRITAQAQSSDSISTVAMDKASTEAIGKTASSHFGASAGADDGEASANGKFGHSSSSKRNSNSNTGSNNQNSDVTSNTVMDIFQEWKGGQSGCSPEEWRKSLLPVFNSNWKIIDSHVDECKGVWHWIDNKNTQENVCNAWRDMFIKEIGLRGENSEALVNGNCSGSASLQDFRKSLVDAKKQEDNEARLKNKQSCLARTGFYWNGEACKQNVCKCGSETGTTGTACPKNGETSCKDSQKAKCSTMMCPLKFIKKSNIDNTLCATDTCGLQDRDTCCKNYKLTKRFTVTIRTKNCCFCGTFSPLSINIKGDGEETGWVVLTDDLNEGDVNDFTITADKEFIPTQLCLKGDGYCVTSATPGVTLYNGDLRKDLSSKIADVSNWNDFNNFVPQCGPV
jgi:hypothetical protein